MTTPHPSFRALHQRGNPFILANARDAAMAMFGNGDFTPLGGVSGDEIDALLARGSSG